jgi:hypothetical protein
MYFQKLEVLSQVKEFTNQYPAILALDSWLATLPKIFYDRIVPELFSRSAGVDFGVSHDLFKELEKVKIIKERYMVVCPKCRDVIFYHDDINEVIEFIDQYNENEKICDNCDIQNKLYTDNIRIFYRLIEKPNKEQDIKKKTIFHNLNNSEQAQNFSESFIEDPQKYMSEIKEIEKLDKVSTDPVKTEIMKYLKLI